MEKRSYSFTYDHYDQMMDAHKLTGRLFGFISFNFIYSKFTFAVFLAIPILLLFWIVSISIVWVCVIFVVYVIFSIEYNRVYDYRDIVFLACHTSQLVFEGEISAGIPQLPEAPDYIDQTDVDIIFADALYDHRKPTFFRYARELLFPN